MALVTKNDVTQIFAIQAPSIDLPPTFSNYPRGWDTARSNNGKPTIKQFNYIQQRTDQNVLWIHQNGAALPYDAAMEYAEGAVVVKDGELQKKQGASWVIPYLGKSNNLDDVSDKATARNNLEVMSATEVNTAISNAIPPTTPDATEIVAGKVKINNTLTSTATDAALTAAQGKVLNDQAFGVAQSWQNVARSVNTTYTNTTSRPIVVNVTANGYQATTTITASTQGNSFIIGVDSTPYDTLAAGSFVVPSGVGYSVSVAHGSLQTWYEFR